MVFSMANLHTLQVQAETRNETEKQKIDNRKKIEDKKRTVTNKTKTDEKQKSSIIRNYNIHKYR